jgi:hypothetical protein
MKSMALSVVLCASLLLPASGRASEISTEDARLLATTWVQDQGVAGAIAYPEALELTPRIVIPWAAGTRVRLQQTLLGIPVHGHEVILSYDLDGRLVRQHGEPLASVLLDPTPSFPLPLAAELAQGAAWLLYGKGSLWPARGELRVLLDPRAVTRLVWQVEVSVAEPIGAWRFFIDAHDGTLLHHNKTLWTARGNIYPTNPDVSEVEEVDIAGITGSSLLGEYAQVRSCIDWDPDETQCTGKTTLAAADGNGDFLYDPAATSLDDPFAEVQMYYHLDLISRWFQDRFNFRHYFGVIQGESIEGIVNFEYNNAFWGDIDGDGIGEVSFGQTASYDFAYDADVIYHEFGHSVFGRIVNPGFIGADAYGVEWATGALNEGTADFFALVLTGDPLLGEYAAGGLVTGTTFIRDLEDDRHCPTDLYGESHRDGEVWGALGWNMIEDELIGPELAADVIYGAIATWASDVNWAEAGQSIVDTTADLLAADVISQEQHDAIVAQGQNSGVIGCGRVIRLDENQEPTLYMIHVGFMGDILVPLGHQFSLDADENTYRLRFRVKEFARTDPNLGWRVHVRRGEYVHHDLQPLGGFEVPVVTDFDFSVDGEGGDVEINIDLESDPPIEPGATYYFSITSRPDGNIQGYAAAEITVDGDSWHIIPPEPEPAGCTGCAAPAGDSGNSADGAAAVAGLLLLGGGLRRRRQPPLS